MGSYEASERERLGFTRPCATCKDTGKVKATKDECMFGPTGLFGGSHWGHFCKQACPVCHGKMPVWVFLRKDVGRHPMGTRCRLIAIEGKILDRCPNASISIDNETHVVYSTDLSSPGDKAHRDMPTYDESGVGRRFLDSDFAPPMRRSDSVPMRRT